MLSLNMKHAALAMLLTANGAIPAQAQNERQVEVEIQADVQLVPAAQPANANRPSRPFPRDEKEALHRMHEATFPQPGGMPMRGATGLGQQRIMMQVPLANAMDQYWIGVECQPLDAAMRTALEITEKHGILVARVTEESPAAKAGVQAGDILLQWCDAEQNCLPIESVEHLVKLVQDAAAKQPEKAVKLEYRRRGKTDTVELTPAKRVVAQSLTLNMGNLAAHEHTRHQQSAMQQELKLLKDRRDAAKKELDAIGAKTSRSGPVNKNDVANQTKAEIQYKLLEAQLQQAEAQLKQFEVWAKAMSDHGFALGRANANFDVLIPAPGIVTRSNLGPVPAVAQVDGHAQMKAAEWPDDLSVTMTRRGNKPAQFVVERGENKWQVTAETLKDLPPEVRVLVEPLAEPQRSRMMRLWSSSGDDAPGRVELRVPEGERPPVPGLPIAPPRVVIHATPQLPQAPATQATQKQIEDLQKALEQLRKQVELMEKK